MENQEEMIAEILAHLDAETKADVGRMSVIFDENAKEKKNVSHKCCHVYGKPGTEVIGLLDMYTDMNAGKPDNEK